MEETLAGILRIGTLLHDFPNDAHMTLCGQGNCVICVGTKSVCAVWRSGGWFDYNLQPQETINSSKTGALFYSLLSPGT